MIPLQSNCCCSVKAHALACLLCHEVTGSEYRRNLCSYRVCTVSLCSCGCCDGQSLLCSRCRSDGDSNPCLSSCATSTCTGSGPADSKPVTQYSLAIALHVALLYTCVLTCLNSTWKKMPCFNTHQGTGCECIHKEIKTAHAQPTLSTTTHHDRGRCSQLT